MAENAQVSGVAAGAADDPVVEALSGTGLLETEDATLRAVAEVAATICGTPMAAVSLVEQTRQFFSGSVGLPVRMTPRSSSFCAIAMQDPDRPMVVPDAQADPRFASNPMVTGDPGIRSYAGVPLLADEGTPLGAVCAIGDNPRMPTGRQVASLQALGAITSELLQARREAVRLERALDDIEVARRAEAASRERFVSIFTSAPVPMSVVSADGSLLDANESFARLVGRTVPELIGTDIAALSPAHDAERDLELARQLLARGTGSIWREKRYLRADGSPVPALVTSSIVRDGDGVATFFSVVEPIEQRRAAEARLLELQSAHDGIVSLDATGRVTSWNLGAERVLGHSAADMLGRTMDVVIPSELRLAHADGLRRVSAGGAPRLVGSAVQVPAVRADGRRITVELSLSRWSEDGAAGHTAVLRDVTARLRAERLGELVRSCALAANRASDPVAAGELLREICERLGWLAAQVWTEDAPQALWSVSPHDHPAGGTCTLGALAARGDAPSRDVVPLDGVTRTARGEQLRDGAVGAAVDGCGLTAAVAVPVLAQGRPVGVLTGYAGVGASGTDEGGADPEVVAVLEQIGTLVGQIVERQRTAALLRHQAGHDPLTELANRRRLLERISELQAGLAAGRTEGLHALVLLDLHRFSVVNDSLGYAAGDQVLQDVAQRLRAAAGPGDLVARLGGDEFVVVAHDPGGDPACAAELAARFHGAVAGAVTVAGQAVRLRASAGVCVLGPDHAAVAHYPASVLRDADAALRRAKAAGVGSVAVFDAAMRSDAAQRLTDEMDLATAIAAGGLELHYQPVIDLGNGRPVSAEALVRWPRAGHGLVPPDAFIPLAEATGLVVELGRWVLQQACRDAAAWPRTVPSMARAAVGVNVSPRQLVHPRFLDDVREALSASGLPAERLVLEVTETALVEDAKTTFEVLRALRRYGVRVALDDFGTGYSSLSHVQTLPADILKIDKSFVDAVTGPDQGTALVEVVLKLAAATGLSVVAEGIESSEQAEALRRLGCGNGQGYLWSRPVPLSRLATALGTAAPDPAGTPSGG